VQQHEWARLLPLAQYVWNSWPSSTTKQAPFYTLIGYIPQAHQPMQTSNIPSLQERMAKIHNSQTAAQEALQRAQDLLTSKTTLHYQPYNVGDQVWLEGTNLKCIEGTPKLSPRQYGPFRVAAKVSHVAYRLELSETWQIHNVFHASLLTPYCETPKHGLNFLQPPPDIIDEEPEWEVKKILKEHTFGRWKKKQYLVHWKGYSPAHDSWVSRDDMHAKELIAEFEGQGPSIKAALESELDSMTTFCAPSPSPLTTSSEESHSTTDTSLNTTDSNSAPFYTAPSTPTNDMANYEDKVGNYKFYSPNPHPSDYPIMYTP